MVLSYETTDRLTRSPDGLVAGVCAGLAARLGIEPLVLRLLWVAALLCFGAGLLAYAILWWLMPRADAVPVEATIWRRNADGSHHPPLARTASDRKLLGVCGGLARRWNADPTIVRLGALALLGMSAGLAVVAYLVLT